MRVSFCLVFFLLIFTSNFAQNYTLKGIIVDNQTQELLFYATVGLLKAEDSTAVVGVSSDASGQFEISNIKQGSYLFQASYVGYEMYHVSFSVEGEDKIIQMDTIRLMPNTTLSTFTVEDKRPVYMTDGEKTLYNVSEDPGVQTGTAADALQNAPGVEVDIEGNITLRGVSSVEIWINDQPSRLNAENLKTYIQQLPANSLERIEVIANPSARYSSQGTGGIINLVTKTNIRKNSFISFGINGSTKPMASPWVSYMWANEKFSINVYGYGYYQKHNSTAYGYNIAYNNNMDTSSYLEVNSKSGQTAFAGGLFINGSYIFDTMNFLSFWAGGYGGDNTTTSFEDRIHDEYLTNSGHYLFTMDTKGRNTYAGGYGGVWYQHKFNNKGHKLTANIGGSIFNSNYDHNFIRTYQHPHTELSRNKKITMINKTNILQMNLDYTAPYCKTGEISLGVQGQYSPGIDYYKSDTLQNTTSQYEMDSVRFKDAYPNSSGFDSYFTIQQKFGRFTIKGGVRVQYKYLGYDVKNSPQDNVGNNYWDWFPSLHLSYSSKSMHNFTLSYTRRIAYPEANQLSSFILYQEDSYYLGNKSLLPTFTNSIEAGWTKYFEKFGSVGLSAYFKNNKDEINQLTDVVYSDFFGRFVPFYIPVNSGKSHTYGGEANVMYKLKAFMNINFNANIYKSHSETVFRENDPIAITDNLTYSFRLSFWAKVWKFLEINASGNYHSKTKTLFAEEEPVYSLNCGLRADFWKRKISVFLNVQDIFNWNKRENRTTNPYYESYSSSVYNSRFISTGITFRFGKMEMEQQARTGGKME